MSLIRSSSAEMLSGRTAKGRMRRSAYSSLKTIRVDSQTSSGRQLGRLQRTRDTERNAGTSSKEPYDICSSPMLVRSA